MVLLYEFAKNQDDSFNITRAYVGVAWELELCVRRRTRGKQPTCDLPRYDAESARTTMHPAVP